MQLASPLDFPHRFHLVSPDTINVFVEVYRDAGAPAAHKETHHYQVWRDAVAAMMAEPRTSEKFTNLFPADDGW